MCPLRRQQSTRRRPGPVGCLRVICLREPGSAQSRPLTVSSSLPFPPKTTLWTSPGCFARARRSGCASTVPTTPTTRVSAKGQRVLGDVNTLLARSASHTTIFRQPERLALARAGHVPRQVHRHGHSQPIRKGAPTPFREKKKKREEKFEGSCGKAPGHFSSRFVLLPPSTTILFSSASSFFSAFPPLSSAINRMPCSATQPSPYAVFQSLYGIQNHNVFPPIQSSGHSLRITTHQLDVS
jgi:hypothetical protein